MNTAARPCPLCQVFASQVFVLLAADVQSQLKEKPRVACETAVCNVYTYHIKAQTITLTNMTY